MRPLLSRTRGVDGVELPYRRAVDGCFRGCLRCCCCCCCCCILLLKYRYAAVWVRNATNFVLRYRVKPSGAQPLLRRRRQLRGYTTHQPDDKFLEPMDTWVVCRGDPLLSDESTNADFREPQVAGGDTDVGGGDSVSGTDDSADGEDHTGGHARSRSGGNIGGGGDGDGDGGGGGGGGGGAIGETVPASASESSAWMEIEEVSISPRTRRQRAGVSVGSPRESDTTPTATPETLRGSLMEHRQRVRRRARAGGGQHGGGNSSDAIGGLSNGEQSVPVDAAALADDLVGHRTMSRRRKLTSMGMGMGRLQRAPQVTLAALDLTATSQASHITKATSGVAGGGAAAAAAALGQQPIRVRIFMPMRCKWESGYLGIKAADRRHSPVVALSRSKSSLVRFLGTNQHRQGVYRLQQSTGSSVVRTNIIFICVFVQLLLL